MFFAYDEKFQKLDEQRRALEVGVHRREREINEAMEAMGFEFERLRQEREFEFRQQLQQMEHQRQQQREQEELGFFALEQERRQLEQQEREGQDKIGRRFGEIDRQQDLLERQWAQKRRQFEENGGELGNYRLNLEGGGRIQRGQRPGVQSPSSEEQSEPRKSRGFLINPKAGEAVSGIDDIMNPMTLTIIGVVPTMVTTGVTLFRSS